MRTAEELLESFELEELSLLPSSGGRFEVLVDEKHLVYSKMETGRHAEDGEIRSAVLALTDDTR